MQNRYQTNKILSIIGFSPSTNLKLLFLPRSMLLFNPPPLSSSYHFLPPNPLRRSRSNSSSHSNRLLLPRLPIPISVPIPTAIPLRPNRRCRSCHRYNSQHPSIPSRCLFRSRDRGIRCRSRDDDGDCGFLRDGCCGCEFRFGGR